MENLDIRVGGILGGQLPGLLAVGGIKAELLYRTGLLGPRTRASEIDDVRLEHGEHVPSRILCNLRPYMG